MASYPTPSRGNKLTISFGLVNVGVKYAPMVDPQGGRLSGRFLNPANLTPAKQVYIDEATGEVVEKVTGYPYEDGFVVLDGEDKAALKSERDGRLELKSFIEPDQVDPLYFEKTHLVWPEKGNEDGYDLICAVLADSGRYLVGQAVLRDSTKVIVLRYGQGCLMAHVCTYDTNLRWDDHKLITMGHGERPAPDQALVDMATEVFGNLSGDFDWSSVTDEYDARLRAAVEAAAEGRPIEKVAEVAAKPTADLMDALKASVAAAKATQKSAELKEVANGKKKLAAASKS
jgi:DNA end-binding protein Ku